MNADKKITLIAPNEFAKVTSAFCTGNAMRHRLELLEEGVFVRIVQFLAVLCGKALLINELNVSSFGYFAVPRSLAGRRSARGQRHFWHETYENPCLG
jgi:hypothetical protein